MKKHPRNPKKQTKNSTPTPLPFSDDIGKTFRRRRLDLNLTLDDVVAETRIQKPIIKSIEKSNFDELPHSVYSLGFIKRYARLLGLDANTAAAKYLHARGPLPRAGSRLNRQRVRSPIIGSKLFAWLAAGVGLVVVAGYLVWQLAVLTSPPRLSIAEPVEDKIVNSQNIEIRGSTTPGAEVSVNGQVVYVDDDGSFSTTITLSPGLNVVRVEATNRRDQTARAERNVLYQAP